MVYTVLAHRSRNDAGSIRNGQIASGIHRNSQVRQNQIAYHFRVCRSSSDGQAGIRRRTVFALRALRAGVAGVAFLSLRAGFAGVALLSLRTGFASVALLSLRAGFASVALLSLRAGFAGVAFLSLRTGFASVAFLSLRAGFAGVAFLSLRTGFASVAFLSFLTLFAFLSLTVARCNALQNLILAFDLICKRLTCFIAHRMIDEFPCVIHFLSPFIWKNILSQQHRRRLSCYSVAMPQCT